jgi:ABC-type spermidine/putrescine transport system permease subunit II
MTVFLNIALAFAVLGVVVALGVGIFSLVRGGQFGRNWSNKMMRLRVVFQAIAIAIILVAFWVGSNASG